MLKLKLAVLTALMLLLGMPLVAQASINTLSTLDLKADCDITAEELAAGLLYDLKPHAGDYIDAYHSTGINPVFLAAKDAVESGWGRTRLGEHNISGFFTTQSFNSVSHNIAYVSDFLNQNYLSEDGKYFEGTTVSAVNTYWNGNSAWEREVLDVMSGIYTRIDTYRNSYQTMETLLALPYEQRGEMFQSLSKEDQDAVLARQALMQSGSAVQGGNIQTLSTGTAVANTTAQTVDTATKSAPDSQSSVIEKSTEIALTQQANDHLTQDRSKYKENTTATEQVQGEQLREDTAKYATPKKGNAQVPEDLPNGTYWDE